LFNTVTDMATFDLDAYFARIGYAGPRTPALATLHAVTLHHTAAIPFENLDVLLDRGISLEPADVFRKLVHERRGGYCFEQNFLLLSALEALGFAVTPLSARVRWQRPRAETPPRTHLFVRVDMADGTWLTDAGVGGLSLTAALRFEPGLEQPTPHEPRRIVREEGRYFHQALLGGAWHDVCEFTGEEMPVIDREVANWWTSTCPQSRFRQRLTAARALRDGGRLALLNREFTVRHADGRSETRMIDGPEALLAVLAEHFGLHFPAGTRFGPPGSPWPT
jgi:N-hydroxyarylamine O-acetyltransferase